MGLAVGIDLGTTNSVIARIDEHGRPVVIANGDNSAITPSVICFTGQETLIGEAAKEMQRLGTYPVAAFFKRQMGDPQFIFHAHGVDYSATELSALVLGRLKADAEARLGQPITHAVVTVPAYFRDVERKATIAAGTAAGLEVLQVINEPTAAAVAYGLGRKEEGRRVLVFDLGGGTFDVTLLELMADGVRVRTSDGDHQLGGKDWDDRIVEFLGGRFEEEFGTDPTSDAESLADLLVHAEDAKKKLTSFDTAMVSLTHGGRRGRYPLSRAAFEEITSDLMERTVVLTRRVLDEMRLGTNDVDGVLLVGGSTRMPMVHKFIADTFGRPPMGGVNVDEAVALGAALVAAEQASHQGSASTFALRGAVTTRDVTNHSLGMIAVSADQSGYVNSIILPKNTEIPCAETRPYQHRTRSRGENQIEVFMTQGESESPASPSYVGRYVIHQVPHERSGRTIVDVTYRYDRSGTVNVTARARGASTDLQVSVEELPPDVPARFLGRPETKAEAPEHVTAYLAFDLSGSMSGAPLREAKKAAHEFVKNTDMSHCSVGVIAFADHVRVKLPACQNARAVETAIDGLDIVNETGYGNAGDPFDEVLSLLKRVDGRRFAIVLADGAWDDQHRAIARAKTCHVDGIDVIAIGFGGADQNFLRQIASSDEGSFYTSMNGLVETFSTIAQILTETGGGAPVPGMQPSGGRLGFLAGIRGALKR